MLGATVLVIHATHWVTPLQAKSVFTDAKSAALYVANFRFIALKTDYLRRMCCRRSSTTGRSRSKSSSTCVGRW